MVMGVDLGARINLQQWDRAVQTNQKALDYGWLSETEESFVKDMIEEYKLNGSLMEPSRKQFEWFKQIAFEQGKYQ
jgi:hypothetical protein